MTTTWEDRRKAAVSAGQVQLAKLRRAGIYTRVSDDRSGRERSPEEQENDSRRDCDRMAYDVVAVYRDTVGASRHTSKHKVRTDWVRLKDDLAAGLLDVIVAWSIDRTARTLAEFDELGALCREHGVLLLVNGRLYDMDRPEDEAMLSIEAVMAVREAAVLRKRVLRALTANANAGRPHGRTQWGFLRTYDARTGTLVGQVPHPDEAPYVREAMERFAAGEGLRAIARDFDERGIPAPGEGCPESCPKEHRHRTGKWGVSGATKLRQALLNVAYIGHRTYKGDVIRDDDGNPRICWEPLVSVELFDRVQDRLAWQSKHRTNGDVGTGVRHLLSGLITCGECGGPVTFTTLGYNRETPIKVYRCKDKGHLGRKAEWCEAAVSDLIVGWARNPAALHKLAKSKGAYLATITTELKAVEARLSDAEDAMADGTISAAAFGRLEAKLSPRINELRTEVTQLRSTAPRVLVDLIGKQAQERWDAATLEEKRAIIREVVDLRMVPLKGTGKTGLGIAYTWKADEAGTEHYL